MTIIIVLLIFKSLCQYLQNIVLNCYDKFLNPRRKYHSSSSASSGTINPHRNRTWSLLSKFTSNKSRMSEREELLEQIRARKRAAKQKI